jgi:pyruvate dehydrogenase E1 component alpha subunit
VSDVVAPYGLDRETVDGNDVVAVREAFAAFLDEARSGGGPFLLECLTHRLRGHYEGDPQQYREALAADEWQELDPIVRLQRRGADEGWLAEELPARLEQEARDAVEEAVVSARESAFPSEELAAELVYAT